MNFRDLVLNKLRELFSPPPPPDPQEQLRALLARLHSELREAKIQAADMIRQEKRLEQEADECRHDLERAEVAATIALRNGNEASARRHLEQKLHATQVLRQLEEQLNAFRTQVQGLRDAIEAYKLEIERVEYEQKTWEVRQRTARLKSSLGNDPSSTAISEARALLRASRDAALREEARAEVRDHVRRSQPATRAYQSAADRAVDLELERLRNQLNSKN